MLSLADVEAAARRMGPLVVRTPLERSSVLSDLTEREVYLKFECFQATGSFKLRGALNALLALRDPDRGVITASAGNHGLGIARAAALLDIRATVVVPETASPAKVEALRRSSARLIQRGATYDAAEAAAQELASTTGAAFVSAYNDAAVIAGGGTVALEILDDLPRTGALVVPAGGGGLIGGVSIAAHGRRPDLSVYGAQSEASPALYAALHQGGHPLVDVRDSLADGLAGNVEAGSITLDLVRAHVAAIALVSEDEIARAMRLLLEEEHALVEGSAAVGVAALQRQLIPAHEGPTVIVLTGRNVAASIVQRISSRC